MLQSSWTKKNRLSGQCILCLHCEQVNSEKEQLIEKKHCDISIENVCPRWLQFVFDEKE